MSYLGTTLTLNYIISYGAEGGLRNRLQCSLGTTMPRQVEYPTSYEHPKVVDRLLATECKLDRVLGPLQPPPKPFLPYISWFGVIPKKSQPGKW